MVYRHAMADDVSYRFVWRIPDGLGADVKPIAEEIVRRGRRNEDLGDKYGSRMRLWTSLSYIIGAPAAILAAVSGVLATNGNKHNVVVAALALASAALGGLLTFLNPASRAANANARATAYWRTSIWVRYAVTSELPTADIDAARKLLRELQSREDEEIAASAKPM
jgi:hypothetical protein